MLLAWAYLLLFTRHCKCSNWLRSCSTDLRTFLSPCQMKPFTCLRPPICALMNAVWTLAAQNSSFPLINWLHLLARSRSLPGRRAPQPLTCFKKLFQIWCGRGFGSLSSMWGMTPCWLLCCCFESWQGISQVKGVWTIASRPSSSFWIWELIVSTCLCAFCSPQFSIQLSGICLRLLGKTGHQMRFYRRAASTRESLSLEGLRRELARWSFSDIWLPALP